MTVTADLNSVIMTITGPERKRCSDPEKSFSFPWKWTSNRPKLKHPRTPSQILFYFIFKFLRCHSSHNDATLDYSSEIACCVYFQLILFILFSHPVSCQLCAELALQMRNKSGEKLICLSMMLQRTSVVTDHFMGTYRFYCLRHIRLKIEWYVRQIKTAI